MTPSQIEINKKRDAELMKLRKLLEDVHLESEDNLHMLKKKHQETIQDYMDQLDAMSKTKARSVANLETGMVLLVLTYSRKLLIIWIPRQKIIMSSHVVVVVETYTDPPSCACPTNELWHNQSICAL